MVDAEGSHSPIDNTWQAFEAAESDKAGELEAAYQDIEANNRVLLNRVAGLETSGLEYRGALGEKPANPAIVPGELNLDNMTNTILYLQPDRRGEFAESGELEREQREGSPFLIGGPVPARSQQLIDDMLTGIEAHVDEASSTPEKEVWLGKVGGIQPIRLEFDRTPAKIILGNQETIEQRLSVRAYRVSDPLEANVREVASATVDKKGEPRKRFAAVRRFVSGRRRQF